MGAGASVPELPPICDAISRSEFQNMLMDVYSAYGLMSYYASIIKHSDLAMNGRPPKQLEDDDVKNFDPEAIKRLKRRAVLAENEGIDFELFMYFNKFAERYNNSEGDSSRFQMLHEAVDKCGDVLRLYVSTLNNLCMNQDQKMYKEKPREFTK